MITKLIVLGMTDSLKTAVTLLAMGTPVSPEPGLCAEIVGAVEFTVTVVNNHEVEVIALPARSVAPERVAV